MEPTSTSPTEEPVEPGRLTLDDTTAPAPAAPDLDALDTPATAPGQATNLDLPSLELPHPAPPAAHAPAHLAPPSPVSSAASEAAPFTGGDYVESLARQAYGEPATEPAPPPAGTSAVDSPFAASSGAPAAVNDPAYSQPQFGLPYPQAHGQLVPDSRLSAGDQQTWASAAHWSSLVAGLAALPFLGPLLIMAIQGPKDERVRENAVESLNFDLTCVIGFLISFVLMFVGIGLLTAPVIGVLWVVFKVIATIQTANGNDYRYPISIRMVK